MRSGDLAEQVGVHQTTLTRTADRLVAGGWVRRETSSESRREVLVHLTKDGQNLVTRVMTQRRHEIEAVLDNTDERSRKAILRGFKAFALAAEAGGQGPAHHRHVIDGHGDLRETSWVDPVARPLDHAADALDERGLPQRRARAWAPTARWAGGVPLRTVRSRGCPPGSGAVCVQDAAGSNQAWWTTSRTARPTLRLRDTGQGASLRRCPSDIPAHGGARCGGARETGHHGEVRCGGASGRSQASHMERASRRR